MACIHNIVLSDVIRFFLTSVPRLCSIFFNSDGAIEAGLKDCFTSAREQNSDQEFSVFYGLCNISSLTKDVSNKI